MNGERAKTDEPVEQLAEEAAVENPDPQTRRESFELELMDEDRSEEGEHVEVEAAAERSDRTGAGAGDRAAPRDPGTR